MKTQLQKVVDSINRDEFKQLSQKQENQESSGAL
jgi:hypothetical protein